MSVLKVLLDGKEIYNFDLALGREYVIGRSSECDIVLNKTSVSRQHGKIFFDGESWHLEVTARYGQALQAGELHSQILLKDDQSFFIEGYEFQFTNQVKVEKSEDDKSEKDKSEIKVEISDVSSPGPTQDYYLPVEGGELGPPGDEDLPDVFENTAIATEMSLPCLHVTNMENDEEMLITLKGNHWIAGRSSSCQIKMEESKASRQHFEISKVGFGYEITDLGSSNGTYLNGEKLKEHERTPLSLGDEIRVGKTLLNFQMHSSSFQDQLAKIPEDLFKDEDTAVNSSISEIKHAPAAIKLGGLSHSEEKRKHLMRGAAALIVVIAILVGLNMEDSGESTETSIIPHGEDRPTNMIQLTAEQKKLAEDTYQLAKSLFIQQKYQSAKAEVQKLHSLVPVYKDSREMENYIHQAIQIENDRERLRIEREKQLAISEKVKEIVRSCDSKVHTATTLTNIQGCLQPAIEMDPENSSIQTLLNKVAAMEDRRKNAQYAKETYEAQLKSGVSLYQRAKIAESRKDYLQAITLFSNFANSNYPDPTGNKAKARESIARLKEQIKVGVNQLVAKAESLKSEEKFREAYQTLSQAIKWDPSDHRILNLMTAVESDLKKKMRALYNDGVLEENIGNLESAKVKWRTIRDQDLDSGEYKRKATSKLRKYGE